jgi:hypothetical protein
LTSSIDYGEIAKPSATVRHDFEAARRLGRLCQTIFEAARSRRWEVSAHGLESQLIRTMLLSKRQLETAMNEGLA